MSIHGTKVEVVNLPPCDLCKQAGYWSLAHYDGKTVFGPWAYMCPEHFQRFGLGLGVGLGQELVLVSEEGEGEKND